MNDSDELFFGVLPFSKVAEAHSFRRAAESLGVSSAAVSKSVSRLEERLGVRLLTRTSRAVALTPEGVRYLERCREAIASMQAARESMSESRKSPSGELRLSMSHILGPHVVPALPRFAARYPKVALDVSISDRVSRLQEERIDVGLRVGVRDNSNLIQKVLLKTRWVTLASPAFLARHGTPRVPADLAGLNCLRFVLPNGKPQDFSFSHATLAGGHKQSMAGNLLIDHGQHLLDAVLAGMGVAQVLDFMAQGPLQRGELSEVLPTFSAAGPAVCAVSAPERSKAPSVRAFQAFAAELFAKLTREPAPPT